MKKNVLTLMVSLLTMVLFSQEKKTDGKMHDPKLAGCWKGSEAGQQIEGVKKYWVSCRMADGTSMLLFIAIDEIGEVTQETENGKWWTENGKYYELHNYDNVIDVYKYEVTSEGVNFQSIELMGKVDSTYKFTDYKITED